MRVLLLAAGLSGAIAAGAAQAEPYVDYTPQKGLWHVVTIRVDPNHIDDYVTALKHIWLPGEQIAKRHGLIDSYQIMIKTNAEDGQGNVLLIEHLPSAAMLEPDQARDQQMEREVYAAVPKTQSDQAVEGFNKYRTFVGDDYWGEVVFTP